MPSSWSLPRLLLAAPLLLAGAALAGCGGSSSGTEVEVSASEDGCTVSDTELAAGSTTFAVTNDGDQVTEVYVYGEKDGAYTKVVSEVENIGPGTSRDMDVDLAAGSYEVACKPGQKGDGIRQKVTVTGDGGGSEAADEAYDREVELTIGDEGLSGLDPATAESGEKIEFTLRNDTDGTRTLEVVAPDGDVAAEFDVPASAEGEAVVELADDGDWTVKVEGGASDVEQTLTVG
jgi:hypothetical protein